MPPTAPQSTVELALSIACTTAVNELKSFLSLLAVSRGLQAAIISRGVTSKWTLHYTPGNSSLAHTCAFADWLQKYHMLVKRLHLNTPCSRLQQLSDDHAIALSMGLRFPLQLVSLIITEAVPLKLLQHVDAQQLTALRVLRISHKKDAVASRALATELGRFCQLQRLELRLPAVCREGYGSSLTQLTALTQLTLDRPCSPASCQYIPSQLQSLHCTWLNDAALSNMHHLLELTELVLNDPLVTGAALAAAARCLSKLRVLTIATVVSEAPIDEGVLQALCSFSALQRLQLEHLTYLTGYDITIIGQASKLTSLTLEFNCWDPFDLDLSGLTALQQLQILFVGSYGGSPCMAVTTFGDALRNLKQLTELTVGGSLRDLALAQVLSCTQLSTLRLNCREYNLDKEDDRNIFPQLDEEDALFSVPGCYVLTTIALNMLQLQRLTIWACPPDKMLAVVNGPWLPNLRELGLYKHQKHANLNSAELEVLLSVVRQARPALQVFRA